MGLYVSAAVLAIGVLEQLWLGRLLEPSSPKLRLLYEFQRDAFVQVGALGVVLFGTFLLLRRVAPKAGERLGTALRRVLPNVLLALIVAFVAGEVGLRVLFSDGMFFGSRAGPLVRRYERDFRSNRYPGPSRGPEVAGPKGRGVVRVLVQGDSITWGQGIKDEGQIYTSRLLAALRERHPRTEMAVFARPGWETDSHLETMRALGDEVDPDVIVYQWFVNDCEVVTKPLRPGSIPLWRELFFHERLRTVSYLWFFLDYQLGNLFATGGDGYADHMLRLFGADTPEWREYASLFGEWSLEARARTPRVLVLLFPRMGASQARLDPVYERFTALCEEKGCVPVPTADVLEDLGYGPHLWSTPFDAHPGPQVNEAVADRLSSRIVELWPDLFPVPDGE